jgi:hypothetical protein
LTAGDSCRTWVRGPEDHSKISPFEVYYQLAQ